MSNDEIIEMAEKCGFTKTHTGEVQLWLCNKNDIERLIQLAKKSEREECALLCENFSDTDSYDGGITTEYHAILIRQRGEA